MKSPANVYGYPPEVWRRFCACAHAGVLAGEGVIAAEAGSVAARSLLKISARVRNRAIAEARFQAYGCPTTVAVGDWLAERLQGQPVSTLQSGGFEAASIRQALEIGEAQTHCALMGVDLIRALSQQAVN